MILAALLFEISCGKTDVQTVRQIINAAEHPTHVTAVITFYTTVLGFTTDERRLRDKMSILVCEGSGDRCRAGWSPRCHRDGVARSSRRRRGEAGQFLPQQRAPPLAAHHSRPQGSRCQEILRKVLRWCH